MRILVLIHEFPPIGGGGGRAAQDICRGLAARGHEIRVLTAHLDGLLERDIQEGYEVIRLRSGRKQAFRASLSVMAGYLLKASWEGLRLVRTWRPDVIHVHFAVPAGPAAMLISRLSGIPYVLTAQLGDVPGGTPEKTDRWFRWIYPLTPPIWKSAAAVVAVSEFTRMLALKHYPVEIKIIPNGVDCKSLGPDKIRLGSPPQIVFAGRFMTQKNPVQVVRTLASLRDLPWFCTMFGDGPLHREVEIEIAKQGLQERFSLPGWVKPEEVIDWFHQSDILFMPSRTEGLPLVGVQALATGLAIVAGDVGGFIDLVEPDVNGSLIDPDSPEQATQAIRKLLTNPEVLRAQRESSQQIAWRFDLNHVVDQYENCFLHLVKNQKRGYHA